VSGQPGNVDQEAATFTCHTANLILFILTIFFEVTINKMVI